MPTLANRQTVAPVSFRCKLSTLVPYLRQLSEQRRENNGRRNSVRIAS
ncbi:hypothetical protein ACFSC6_03715 [Rufibacter sediminis]|uniref:Uncharacterized protein n=1 Tax=Rufibacter sediminis TaxID=2762756 RepID=A0ABR6VP60_9BACT|nr:hypothetical protein [Rufibacter sediminis]MBC3538930.1 hypothetical protein [Rufibacter sediminis]